MTSYLLPHVLVASRQLDESLGRDILADFRARLWQEFHPWPLSNDLVFSAISTVEQFRLRSGDAIHLASALAVWEAVSPVPVVMVSSDRELTLSAGGAGLDVLDPAGSAAIRQPPVRLQVPMEASEV